MSVHYHEHAERGRYTAPGDADPDAGADVNPSASLFFDPVTSLGGGSRAAQIVRVIDGDTVRARLASGRQLTVRLIGIDTPETKRPGVAVECGGKQASAFMRRIAFDHGGGRHVTLVSDPSQDQTDSYGRTLAFLDARGKGDLGRLMLRAGWASVYVFEQPFARRDRYQDRRRRRARIDRSVGAMPRRLPQRVLTPRTARRRLHRASLAASPCAGAAC